MKYDKEATDLLLKSYQGYTTAEGHIVLPKTVAELAEMFEVPERSIIAKLSSLGVYKKKGYLNKRGEVPIRKEEYIERIADHLDTSIDILESLEKVNKNVLALLDKALSSLNN